MILSTNIDTNNENERKKKLSRPLHTLIYLVKWQLANFIRTKLSLYINSNNTRENGN